MRFFTDRRLIYILTNDDDYDYDYEDKADYKKKPSYKPDDEYNEKYDFSVETFITSKFNTFFNLIILGGLLLLPMAIAAELNLEAISAQIQALTNLLTEYYVVLNNQLASVITTLADIVTTLATLTTSVTGITTTLTGITTTLTGITTSLTSIQTTLTAIQAAIAGIGRRRRIIDYEDFDPFVLNVTTDKIEDHFWFIFDIPKNITDYKIQFENAEDFDISMIELCIEEALAQDLHKVI